jgi:hypothetical protein
MWVVEQLGKELPRRSPFVAYTLVTVDAEGWPHAALLSAGELWTPTSGRICASLWPSSGTTENLTRAGRGLLEIGGETGLVDIRLSARRCPDAMRPHRALFACDVLEVRNDVVGYAKVTSGIKFELTKPDVLEQWQSARDLMRSNSCLLASMEK